MTTPTIASIHTMLRPLAAGALAVLLCSCAATSVKNTWKSPDSQQPVGKVAVLAIAHNGSVRKGFENRFATQLVNAGTQAMVTYDSLSLPEIKQDKRTAADRILANGVDALLILRVVDTGTYYRESQPGGERYAGAITGFETMGWYDYYSVAFMNMSPTYGTLKQTVYLETGVYDLKTEKRLWSLLTKTVLEEHADGVAEADRLVPKIVAAMRKDGILR